MEINSTKRVKFITNPRFYGRFPYVIMSGNPVTYHGVNAVVLSQHHNTSERILRHIANAYRLIYQGNFSVQDAVQKIIDQVPMSEEIENIVNFVKNSERGIVK